MNIRRHARSSVMIVGTLILIVAVLLSSGCATEQPAPTADPQSQATQAPASDATAAPSGQASGTQRDHILVGRPNPTTGPIAGFGEGTPWVEEKALEAINKDGGIFIEEAGKKLPVKIKVVDTESNPTKAAEVASKLILDDKVDVMLAFHTPDTVNPVSAACERYEVPCITVDAPVEAWLTGGPYKWSFLASFTVDELVEVYMDQWDTVDTNKKVGGLFSNDPDGVMISALVAEKSLKRGYTYIDTGKFPYGTKDFSAAINEFKSEDCEIIVSNMIPPDTATAWRQMASQGYVPKLASIGKAALFPADMEALGDDLALAISTECWWHASFPYKSSLTGETAREFADAWEAHSGKQWQGPLAVKMTGMEILKDVLERAGSLDKNKIREAIAATDLDTIMGHVKYGENNQAPLPMTDGQWVKGEKWPWEMQIVNADRYPEIKTTAETIFPIPR